MRNYLLAEHVRACVTSAGAIFLDPRRDACSGIDASQATALEAAVEGWPKSSNAKADSQSDSSALHISLCAAGLLVLARDAANRTHHHNSMNLLSN